MRSVVCSLVLCSAAVQAGDKLVVSGLAAGVKELDLFDSQTGEYKRSLAEDELAFPIAILEDQQGNFVIELQGQRYAIGSTLVTTTKNYSVDTALHCDNSMPRPAASTRGITGRGCQQ